MLTDIKVATAAWKKIIGDTGDTTASTSTDELTIAGGDNISTTIVGDTVTIDGAASLTEISSITSPAGLDLTLDAGSGEIDMSGDLIKNVGTVDGVDISVLETDVNGFPDELKNLIQVEIQQLENIGAVTISATQWGYLGELNQSLITTATPQFSALTVNGNITVTGNVDGIDIAAIKLNSMPSAANGDIDANTQKIINVVDPTAVQHAATKNYVDTVIGGATLFAFKTINCPAGTDPIADATTDTLNITATGDITITGNATTDTIDFSVTKYTDLEVEAVITAELVGGESIDNAIDALILAHNVANRHIDHSAITITAGTGLSGGGTINANLTIDCDITQYTDVLAVAAVEAAGLSLASTKVIVSADEDLTFTFGRAALGSPTTDELFIAHRDNMNTSSYALKQLAVGTTVLNAETGKNIVLADNGVGIIDINGTGLSLRSGKVITSPDEDLTFTFGRGAIGSPSVDIAYFGHRDFLTMTNYALKQYPDGDTFLNAPAARSVRFNINNVQKMQLQADGNFILSAGTDINEFSIDGTLAGNSDDAVPTEQATKTYVDAAVVAGGAPDTYYCDTEADINAAITAIGAGAGIIVLESGTITLTAAITINIAGSVVIQGMGDLTIIDINGDWKAFNITGCASCVLKDFKIDATDLTTATREIIDITEAANNKVVVDNITTVGDGTNGRGIELNSDNCVIINCRITSVSIGIITVAGAEYTQIENNAINTNASSGIVLQANYATVSNNIVHTNTTYGLTSSAEYCSISDNIFYNNGSGIYLDGADYNTVSGNNCYGNTTTGIYLTGADYNTISENIVCISLRGIYIDGDNNSISGNNCSNNGGNSALNLAGIYVINDSRNNTITGNTCNSINNVGAGRGDGIFLDGSRTTVSGNTCNSNDDNGIILDDGSVNNTISGNTCFNNDGTSANPITGIHLTTNCDKNTISGNNCNSNNNAGGGTGYGIYIANANDDDNTVMGNTALDNDTNYSDIGTNTFDSTTTDGDPLNNFVAGAG